MLRRLARYLNRLLLGPAARAGQQVLDPDARLALAPRALEDRVAGALIVDPEPRRVGHLIVYEGGRRAIGPVGDGPLGRPAPVSTSGRRSSAGRT